MGRCLGGWVGGWVGGTDLEEGHDGLGALGFWIFDLVAFVCDDDLGRWVGGWVGGLIELLPCFVNGEKR